LNECELLPNCLAAYPTGAIDVILRLWMSAFL